MRKREAFASIFTPNFKRCVRIIKSAGAIAPKRYSTFPRTNYIYALTAINCGCDDRRIAAYLW